MRKAIAIFFLLSFTASFTEAGQLIKLPLLVEHYADHQSNDRTVSFASFLREHYLDSHQSDGDEKEDSQLPFKTCSLTTTGSVFLPSATILFLQPVAGKTVIANSTHDNFILQDPLFGIFHPPRIV
ncbi:MAG: hypothetical protein EOO10_21695 [Chitinophagaceae bacterium]|nr:MAG: hypothetical protein EOO10_21695 [Chitinophagaceae bacterium]